MKMKLLKPLATCVFMSFFGLIGGAAQAGLPDGWDDNYPPSKKRVDGYTIKYCQVNEEEEALDFCSDRAVSAYKRLATATNVNFNKKHVLIGFKGIRQGDGAKYMQYAAVDPAAKKVYPFDFILYAIDNSNFEKVKISSKKDTLCADSVAMFSGDRQLKSYGAMKGPRGQDTTCFKFEDEFGFDIIPSAN